MIAELFKALLGFFLTFEEAEEEDGNGNVVKTGKKKAQVHHRGMLTLLACSFCVFAVWALGMYPPGSGFVWAGDFKAEITAQVRPVSEKVDAVDQKLGTLQVSLNEMLAYSTAQSINATKRRLCKATEPEEKSRLTIDIQTLVGKYYRFSGSSYAVPNCGEL